MPLARMMVTPELLIELLHLPRDTEIGNAWMDFRNLANPKVVFLVSHPDIKKDEVCPTFRSHYDEDGKVTEVEFLGWYDG